MTEAPPRRSRRETPAAALALALALAAAFWPVVSGARSFFHGDLYYEHLPIWAATQRALRAGESPFWLDGEYCGQPPLFHQEAPLFYPPTVPLLLTGMPVHRAADLFSLFHYWLAGFAVFLLVRELSGRFAAALFGGVAWMLSARMVQSALWPNAVAVSALVPMGLYGLALIARGARRRGVAIAAVSGGLALLASRPHVLFSALPIAATLAAVLAWKSADRRATLSGFALSAVLAAALGAPAVFPSAALLPETSRAAGLAATEPDFQPLSHGRELDSVFLPVDGRTRWPESAAWPGVVVYVFAAAGIALFAGRREAGAARVAFWACLAGGGLGLALAFGNSGPYRLIAGLPLVRSLRVPERFLFSWSLGLAVAAALAFAAAHARFGRARVWLDAAVVLLAAELVLHARGAAQTAESSLYDVVPAVVEKLRGLGTDSLGFPRRYLSRSNAIYPIPYGDEERRVILRESEDARMGLAMRFGLESVGGYGPTLATTVEYLGSLTPATLRLSGAGAVVTSAPREAGEKPHAPRRPVVQPFDGLPRALLAPEAAVVRPEDAFRVLHWPGFDPTRVAVLEEGEPLAPDPRWAGSAGSVTLRERRPGRVALDATLPAPGVLVLFDSYAKGWRATVDGRSADVERADGAFRAVRLAEGSHRVELEYHPRGVREGAAVAAAGLLGLLLALRRLPADRSDILRGQNSA